MIILMYVLYQKKNSILIIMLMMMIFKPEGGSEKVVLYLVTKKSIKGYKSIRLFGLDTTLYGWITPNIQNKCKNGNQILIRWTMYNRLYMLEPWN